MKDLCAVCLEDITDKNFIWCINCENIIHTKCFNKLYNKCCPYCRNIFTPNYIVISTLNKCISKKYIDKWGKCDCLYRNHTFSIKVIDSYMYIKCMNCNIKTIMGLNNKNI